MKILNCFIIIIIVLFFCFIIFPNKIIINSIDNHLESELNAWRKLFKWCFDNCSNSNIFCAGGQVLALQILKDLFNNNSKYDEFFSLDLINDWDINMYMTERDKIKLVNFAKTLDFQVKYFITNQKSEKNFTLIRFKNKIKKEKS